MRTLVIAAHPDDEVLGCGGTLLGTTGEIRVHFLAQGGTNREDGVVEELQRQAGSVGDLLGSEMSFSGFPDNAMDTVPLLSVAQSIETVIEEFGPELVLTHHRGDLNIDHRITYQAVLTACRPMGGEVQEIRCFEIPSSTEWAFRSSFNPDTFVDISPHLERKWQALCYYKGESRQGSHPRSQQSIEALARWRGSIVGMGAAEAFETVYRRIT